MTKKGRLYLVSTPIGNLADMTQRAIDTLKIVDSIAAEDTRHSQRLLSHYQIHTPLFSLHDYNEDARIEKVIALLSDGKSIALISDAGTPLISDPGFRLVRAVRAADFLVVPVPGACALIAAITASGLPTDRFIFEGFLPAKKNALMNYLSSLKNETRTMVFYESVHRIEKTLLAFRETFGDDRIAVIARELTKTFETIKQATLSELCNWLSADADQQKGEFVIVLSGAPANEEPVAVAELERILQSLLKEVTVKLAVKIACEITGLRKKVVYDCALKLTQC